MFRKNVRKFVMQAFSSPIKQIQARKLRKRIDSFMKKHPEKYLTPEQFEMIFSVYTRWWKICSQLPPAKRTRAIIVENILFYMLERAFWSEIEVSEMICTLLQHLYANHTLFSIKQIEWRIPLVERRASGESYLRYLLRHAYRQRMLVNNKRLVDEPSYQTDCFLPHVVWTWIHNSSYHILALLQYGALLPPVNAARVIGLFIHRTIVDMNCDILPREELRFKNLEFYDKVVYYLKLLIRVSGRLNPEEIWNGDWRWAIERLDRNVLPGLLNRCAMPLSLQHMSRLVIRNRLNECWELPGGIGSLGLPLKLQDYLNLLLD